MIVFSMQIVAPDERRTALLRTLGAMLGPTRVAPGCLEAAHEAKLCAWLGALELQARHFDAADGLLTRALERGDPELTTRANRAIAWEALGRHFDAAGAWADVAARGRGTPLADVASKRLAALSSK